ncbi:MAG: histidine kinase [Tessaracoccus sp.]
MSEDSRVTKHPGQAHRVLGSHPRLRAFLISLLCLVIGAMVLLTSFGVFIEEHGDAGVAAFGGFFLLDLVVGIIACIAVGPIRRSTVGNALLILTGIVSSFALPAWAVAVVRFGERRSFPLDATMVVVMAAGVAGMSVWQYSGLGAQSDFLPTIALSAVATIALLFWGRSRSTRAALITALQRQAESAERERAALAQNRETELALTRGEERRAIARDMHDGISHQLSIVAMHAGALASRGDLGPEQIRDAAQTVRDASAQAGDMLREALTALREPAEDAQASPLPSATTIDALVVAAQARGATVSVTWQETTPEEIPPAHAVALARITEEIIMNATKYAPEEALEITIALEADALVLRARNRLSARVPDSAIGTGHGLTGIAERAGLLGGTATHGPTPDDHFDVIVRFLWH